MHGPCLDPRRILEASRKDAWDLDERSHLETCARCREALAETQRLAMLLGELGRAERDAPSASVLWQHVAARLDAAEVRTRLPFPLAGLSRLGGELLKPAMVASWAVGVLGLFLGIWLAPHSPDLRLEDPYPGSSLVEDQLSLAAMYGSSFPDGNQDALQAPPYGGDSSLTDETPDGGRP